MTQYYLSLLKPQDPSKPTKHPITFNADNTASINLQCINGACGIEWVLYKQDQILVRQQVVAPQQEIVSLTLTKDVEEKITVKASYEEIYTLAAQYEEKSLIYYKKPSRELDIVIIIDGTMLALQEKEIWKKRVESIIDFIKKITKDNNSLKISGFAFADHKIANVSAMDLTPKYLFYPLKIDELQNMSLNTIEEKLLQIPYSSGGDYIDALADALEASTKLHWRKQARKMVLVIGNSPGYSILNPPPLNNVDGLIRTVDIESQAMALHKLGVEIVTIYLPDKIEQEKHSDSLVQEILAFSQKQYQNLASLPEYSFIDDLPKDIQKIKEVNYPIGWGFSWGMLVENL